MPHTPPRSRARLLGGVYLVYFFAAIAGGLLLKGLLVPGDPTSTAHRMLQRPQTAMAASAMTLLATLLYLLLTALFYELFRPVSRRLALFAALCSVTACTIQALGDLLLVSLPVLVANGTGLNPEQVQTLAHALLTMRAAAADEALVLFGVFDCAIAMLIMRSGYLPRIFGWLMGAAGLGWLLYVWPPLGVKLAPVIQLLGFVAEMALMVWLLGKGVDRDTSRRPEAHAR